MAKLPENIILIDKPKGFTSFDIIRVLRKKLGIRKMGHGGTLDPLATGLMIIGINKGTKELNSLLKLSKKYEAEILFGIQTDTGDITGKTIIEKEAPKLTEKEVANVLKNMIGDIELSVPIYSAIKKQGKPLYEYARKGKEIDVPKKIMHIIDNELISLNGVVAVIKFNVKSGTYIRSIAEELGRKLHTVATLKNLRRTSIGDFSVNNAEKIN